MRWGRDGVATIVAVGIVAAGCVQSDHLLAADGTAVIEAGGRRFEFDLTTCEFDDEIDEIHRRRLTVVGVSEDDEFAFLQLFVLEPERPGASETHVASIMTYPDLVVRLATADDDGIRYAGSAPDDWIRTDTSARTAVGSGFELRDSRPGADAVLDDGRLAVNCRG